MPVNNRLLYFMAINKRKNDRKNKIWPPWLKLASFFCMNLTALLFPFNFIIKCTYYEIFIFFALASFFRKLNRNYFLEQTIKNNFNFFSVTHNRFFVVSLQFFCCLLTLSTDVLCRCFLADKNLSMKSLIFAPPYFVI